jgi:hypothetical protein
MGVLMNPANPRPLQDFFSAAIMTEGVLLYSSAQIAGGGIRNKAHIFNNFLHFAKSEWGQYLWTINCIRDGAQRDAGRFGHISDTCHKYLLRIEQNLLNT